MKKRSIPPVSSMYDKYKTYRAQKAKLTQAIREDFFLEAIFIEYALLEDRLRSYLFHMGLLEKRDSACIYPVAYSQVQGIIAPNKTETDGSKADVFQISAKIKIIKTIAQWAASTDEKPAEDSYLWVLKSQFEEIDVDDLLTKLDEIDKWKDYRNELTHGLLNKNLQAVGSEIEGKVFEGRALANAIDAHLKCLKCENRIRKSLDLRSY